MRDNDQKMKFERLLDKKCKELEVLGNSLVYKEKEVLMRIKNKYEQSRLDINPHKLEKTALLAESDSEDSEEDNPQESRS